MFSALSDISVSLLFTKGASHLQPQKSPWPSWRGIHCSPMGITGPDVGGECYNSDTDQNSDTQTWWPTVTSLYRTRLSLYFHKVSASLQPTHNHRRVWREKKPHACTVCTRKQVLSHVISTWLDSWRCMHIYWHNNMFMRIGLYLKQSSTKWSDGSWKRSSTNNAFHFLLHSTRRPVYTLCWRTSSCKDDDVFSPQAATFKESIFFKQPEEKCSDTPTYTRTSKLCKQGQVQDLQIVQLFQTFVSQCQDCYKRQTVPCSREKKENKQNIRSPWCNLGKWTCPHPTHTLLLNSFSTAGSEKKWKKTKSSRREHGVGFHPVIHQVYTWSCDQDLKCTVDYRHFSGQIITIWCDYDLMCSAECWISTKV